MGTGFLGPQVGKVKERMEASGGTVTDEIHSRIRRVLIVARIDLVILFAIVVNMVVKPGGM